MGDTKLKTSIFDSLRINMLKSEIEDIDAFIEIAMSNKLNDKFFRFEFEFEFKSNMAYARFLKLLKKQKKEQLKMYIKHIKERDRLYKKLRWKKIEVKKK